MNIESSAGHKEHEEDSWWSRNRKFVVIIAGFITHLVYIRFKAFSSWVAYIFGVTSLNMSHPICIDLTQRFP